MSETPWPEIGSSSILFILDASHRVEEDLLCEWLETESGFSGKAERVVLPIAHAPENIPAQVLTQALEVSPDTLIVPLRIVWLSSVDKKGVAPRIRDLLLGNPRRPRAGRARRVARQTPERVKRIAADPATLEELRQRFAARYGETANTEQLAEFVAGQAGLALDIAERRRCAQDVARVVFHHAARVSQQDKSSA